MVGDLIGNSNNCLKIGIYFQSTCSLHMSKNGCQNGYKLWSSTESTTVTTAWDDMRKMGHSTQRGACTSL